MDIVAHSLWAGAGAAVLGRHVALAREVGVAIAIVGLAALPDVLHLLPIALWWLAGDGSLAVVLAYAYAVPGQEPPLPPTVQLLSHHLHCLMHSAFVVGAATLVVWALRGSLWIALLGWWSHVLIDVFTHSARYYPSPVFYPITEHGFDGIAWNTPWSLATNYAALAAVGLWLLRTRRMSHDT